MNKKFLPLIVLILASILGVFIWLKCIYPQLIFSHLTIDRAQAVRIAEKNLRERGVEISSFQTAAVFTFDTNTNQYLQSAIGFDGLKQFIVQHQFDMYFWLIRFFKENEKEEYRLTISSETGQVISFGHTMTESEARPFIDQAEAQRRVLKFFENKLGMQVEDYVLKDKFTKVYDHRTEYTFAWQKKGVLIPWNEDVNSGYGKLFMSATISGDEVARYVKNFFSIPDEFNRRIEEENNTGRNLSRVVHFFYVILLVAVIYYLISKRNDLAMHSVKPFYLWAAGIFFILAIVSEFNEYQYMLFNYKNTSPFNLYFWEYFSERLTQIFFVTILIVLPGLSGEMLNYEVSKENPRGAFLHNIRSTFFSRTFGYHVLVGYIVFSIMLGIQSGLIMIGQKYWGVWVEHNWMAKFSTAYWPFLVAFTVAYRAAFTEEILYRLFAFNFWKKIFKNTFIAILFSALIWGFAHSSYPVYPMWFRGLEMTIVGLFLGVMYLRYGIVSCLVGHYLFNVFWNSADYLFGQTNVFYLLSTIGIFLLPLFYAVVCFVLNRSEEVRKLEWKLNAHQKHNLEILKVYLLDNQDKLKAKDPKKLRQEISSHGWDLAVVEVALKDLGWLKES